MLLKVLGFKLHIPLVGLLILIVLVGILTATYIRKSPQVLGLVKGPTILAQEEENLIKHVGTLISLPQGEKPTVWTVSDIDKLKDQSFFKNAKNGDKVLVYTNAKKVVLYRPLEDRVVDVGSVNINQQQSAVAGVESFKVAILNGTKTPDLAKSMEDNIKKLIPLVEVSEKGNTLKSDYSTTILIDLTGKNGSKAKELAQTLSLALAAFPEGEIKPENTDFLIIIGKDKIPTPVPTPTQTPTPTQ